MLRGQASRRRGRDPGRARRRRVRRLGRRRRRPFQPHRQPDDLLEHAAARHRTAPTAARSSTARSSPSPRRAGSSTTSASSTSRWTPATAPRRPGPPARCAANARHAVQDRSTIAYIGDFSSGASAVSAPITNAAGILQVSPASTYGGLTRADGGDKGEPEKYSPSGKLTFARVIPNDIVQAPRPRGSPRAARRSAACSSRTTARCTGRCWRARSAQQAKRDGIDDRARRLGRGRRPALGPRLGRARRSSARAPRRSCWPPRPPRAPSGCGRRCTRPTRASSSSARRRWRRRRSRRPSARPARTTLLASPILPVSRYPSAARDFARRYRARFGRAARGLLRAVRLRVGQGRPRRDLGRPRRGQRAGQGDRSVLRAARSAARSWGATRSTPTATPRCRDFGAYVVRDGRLSFLKSLSR